MTGMLQVDIEGFDKECLRSLEIRNSPIADLLEH